MTSFDVAVVGAGIVGCATAWELSRRGLSVCLVDRGEVSSGTTGLGEGNVLCCDRALGPEVELALAGQALFAELEALLGEEAGVRRKGAVVVHAEAGGWAAEAARVEALRAAGVECELLEAPAVAEAEPELAVVSSAARSSGGAESSVGDRAARSSGGGQAAILGGSFFPRDLQCAPRAIARGLAREAAALGAELRTGVVVEAIAVAGGRVEGLRCASESVAAERVVLAAGAWSAPLARGAGLELPLEPRKGQLVLLERRPGFLRHKVVDGGYMAAVAEAGAGLQVATVMETTSDGRVLVGSSRERRGFDLSMDAAVSRLLLEQAARLAPGVGELRPVDAWAGLRPWLPDGLPAIGPSAAADGLWVATGHEGAGVSLGPLTGRLIAQGICGEPASLELEACSPDRFG